MCGLLLNIFCDVVVFGIKCVMGLGSVCVCEGGWIVIFACFVGFGVIVAFEMCGVLIKFVLIVMFDVVVESGVEGELGEIYVVVVVVEVLFVWFIGK